MADKPDTPDKKDSASGNPLHSTFWDPLEKLVRSHPWISIILSLAVLGFTLAWFTKPLPVDRSITPAQLSLVREAANDANCTLSREKERGANKHSKDPQPNTSNPPTSGRHHPDEAADDNYVGKPAPTKERVIHSLEHGRIAIQYRPGTLQEVISELEKLYQAEPQRVLLFENNTNMEPSLAVTAWGWALICPTSDKGQEQITRAIRVFRDTFRGKGPERVPASS